MGEKESEDTSRSGRDFAPAPPISLRVTNETVKAKYGTGYAGAETLRFAQGDK